MSARKKVSIEKPSKIPGYIIYEVGEHAFEIPDYYEVYAPLGQGAYGIVVLATPPPSKKKNPRKTFFFYSKTTLRNGLNKKTNENVAIKKNFAVFEHDREYQKRILREMKILMHLRNHPNIVSLRDVVRPDSFESFNDVYFITDLMEIGL